MRRSTLLLLASVAMIAIAASERGSAIGQLPPTQSVTNLRAAPGLAITLWASEPAISNPTNIAIDERGRVWVLEAVNYRRQLRNQPDLRADGDRIVILEDTNADGTADAAKVFDHGPHLRAPLGIAVLGGMFFSTILTFYVVPATYFVIERARERRAERAHLPHAVPVAGGR